MTLHALFAPGGTTRSPAIIECRSNTREAKLSTVEWVTCTIP